MLTADEVRRALDLLPFEGYARKILNDPVPAEVAALTTQEPAEVFLGPRRTGRSTRMLCSALASASAGRRIAIYAKPMAMEHALKDIARGWAEKIGILPELIVGHLAPADLEFFDHSWYDAI